MYNHYCESGNRRWGPARIIGMVVGGVVIACIFALAFGWLVMILWNWLMPMLFGLKVITYWQAFGICVLSKILFSGTGHGSRSPGRHGPFPHHGHHMWKRHMNEDWVPAGDPRKWRYYRDYWAERGKKDFEDFLKKKDLAGDAGKEEEPV
jgi:hypothetical protein